MIFLELLWTFFKIGAFTFGGGYAMLPLIEEQVVARNWLTEEEIINFIAVCESTPGPFAINIATYIGIEKGGLFGAFCATLGVVLPSFIVILLVAQAYEKFKNSKLVSGAMSGLKPAVIGLIASAVLSIGKTVFFENGINTEVFTTPPFYIALAIFIVATVAALKKVHPIIIIVVSAALGIVVGYTVGL